MKPKQQIQTKTQQPTQTQIKVSMDDIQTIASRLATLSDSFKRHKHNGTETKKLSEGIITVPMSFETGEQTATKIYFPFSVKITKIRGIVTKQIAATDNGLVTCANSIGNSTNGVITASAGSALNTEISASPTSNNTVGKDSYYKLTSSKTTAGGKILITLEYERI